MAQQAALLTSGKQLSSINETLKKQGSSEKLKRTPSVQERVRTNDSMAMILAKVYAITKKEQEINKAYRKEQIETTKNFNESFIATLKSTSDNVRKAIEKSVKVNEKLLEENKTIREEQKLFEEEKNEEAKALEERRHKELLEALKGKKEPEGKKEKENWLTKLLGPVLSKLLTKLGKTIFNMLPGGAQLLLRGLGQLGRIFVYAVETILPRVISAALANPLTSLALAITGLSLKIGSDYKEMEDKLKKAADAGDIETLKKESQFYVDQINEQGGNISVDEFAKSRLKASKTPQAKSALEKMESKDEDFSSKLEYMQKQGYIIPRGDEKGLQSITEKKVFDPTTKKEKIVKVEKKELDEQLQKASEYAQKNAESRRSRSQSGNVPLSGDVFNKYRETVGKSEGAAMGYDAMYGVYTEKDVDKYKQSETGGKRLTQLTVDEAIAVQNKRRAKGGNTHAMGRYQFIDLPAAKEKAHLKGNELFNAETQDKMFDAYTKANAETLKTNTKDPRTGKIYGPVEVTPYTLRLAHGVGALGAKILLEEAKTNPNKIPADALMLASKKVDGVETHADRLSNPHLGGTNKKGFENITIRSYLENTEQKVAKAMGEKTSGTQLASADVSGASNEELNRLFTEFQQPGGENLLGETATPEKKSIFGLIASELKSELEMLQGFTKGEGAKELQDVLETTKSMFAEIAPSSISPALSALTNVQKMNASLSGQAGSTNITTINQQQLAQGGGGGHTASIPGNIYDINNPSVQAALYGMHNVRPSYG
jgi:hypothetical protein